jgi:hypothetical protein
MQIDLNDDQVALLLDVLYRASGDVHFSYDEQELMGYASVALYQTQCRLEELQKTIQEQSGSNWVHNDVTQRMEPRYKAREETGE